MIGYLSGKILNIDEQTVLIDVRDVGYEVYVGNAREMNLGEIGEKAEVWIFTYVREDQLTLFGFREAIQKKIFVILIGITGIGPKLAMAVLNQMSPQDVVEAITFANVKTLCSVPGIGKKMADRLVLELKDKLGTLFKEQQWSEAARDTGGVLWQDLMVALSGLGFPDQKIRNVITLLRQETKGQQPEINQLLKLALQKIRNC